MALFHFGKKKEENKILPANHDIRSIKVLGGGCKSCHDLLIAAQEAAKRLDLNVEVEYITDMEKIMAYGAMRMPLLVVNEKIVSMGRVLKTAEVEKLLRG